ncbi:protein starmaker-like [Podarcis raffonei]|uniref:protein starmaker-like n=1 Tax=Podarcis raffonei TaxID=65483 RepID=UPI0023297541|nr:protein starmaker-like [Podarcis raffonei]XP_053264860.1 protein starmaker-like [Podarcis raffonei]
MMSQAEESEGIDDGEKNELFLFSYEQSAAEMSPDDEPAKNSCNVSELIMTSQSVKQGQAQHVNRLPFMESHASLFHAIHSITKSIRQFGEHEGGITLKVTKCRHIDRGASQEEAVIKEDLDLAQDSQDSNRDSLNPDLLNPVMVTDSQDRDLAEDSKDHDSKDSGSPKDSQDLVSQESDLAKDSQDLDVRDSKLTKDSQDSESTKDSQDLDARDSELIKDSHDSDLGKDSQDRDLTKDSRGPELAQDSWDPFTWVLELAQDSWDPDSWDPGLAKGSWDVDYWDPDLVKAFLDSDSRSAKDSQDSDLAKDSQDSSSQGPDLTEDSQDPDLTKDSQDPDSWEHDSTKDSQDLDSAKDSQDPDLAKDSRDPDLAKDSQEAKDTSAPVPSTQSKLKSKSVISRTQQKHYLMELPPAHLLPYLVLIKRVMSLPISAIQKQCLSGEILCRIQYFTLKLQKKKLLSRAALAEQPTHRLPTVRETGYVTFDCLRDLQWKLYKGIAKRKPKTIGVERKSSYSYGVTGTTFAKFTEYVLPLIPKGWIVDDSLKFSENMVVLFAQNTDLLEGRV